MNTAQTCQVEVSRYDPKFDSQPYLQRFSVPYDDTTSVLDALQYIKEYLDSSLSYRWSCRMAICGSCGVMVNGIPKLGCKDFLRDYVTKASAADLKAGKAIVTIEPLAHFSIERDLMVNMDEFLKHLEAVQPYIIGGTGGDDSVAQGGNESAAGADTGGEAGLDTGLATGGLATSGLGTSGLDTEALYPDGLDTNTLATDALDAEGVSIGRAPVQQVNRQTPAQLAKYQQYANCINCGLCYAACPQFGLNPDFVGPAAIAIAHRYNLDSRDDGKAQRMNVLNREDGVWPCTFVGFCSEVCPKGVDPAAAINQNKVESSKSMLIQLFKGSRLGGA